MCPTIQTTSILIAFMLPAVLARSVEGQVVISQVYGGGGNSGATLTADFVELFNHGSQAVVLDGWSVQYASASASSWQASALSGTLQPGTYYLVQMAEGSGGTVDLPPPDALGISNLSASSGKVALVHDASALQGECPASATIEDFVGYGTANCFEGQAAAPAGSNLNALRRENDGCEDSDENAADFEPTAPAPRNQDSAAKACAPVAISPSPSPTSTASVSATPSSSPTESLPPSASHTPTQTESTSPTPSRTATRSATFTPTASTTPSPTVSTTPIPTVSATPTPTASTTPSSTGSTTPSTTASHTPSPTESITRTPLATPSATPVADGICGNGTIEPGEQCDDGNNSDGDLCPSSAISRCSYRDSGALIHGNERRRHVRRDGCQLEWYVAHHELSRNRSGAAATTQVCPDQDPGCDFDSSGRQCRFMVVACFNNSDPVLPACAPRELTSFRIVHPRRIRSANNTGEDNRRTLEEAFAALVDPAQPELGAIHGFPLLSGQTNLCSLPFPLDVRRLGNNRGAEDVIVDTFGDDGRGLRRHRSRLRLICVP